MVFDNSMGLFCAFVNGLYVAYVVYVVCLCARVLYSIYYFLVRDGMEGNIQQEGVQNG